MQNKMYNVATLQAAFSGLVGIRQGDLPNTPNIIGSITSSSSGVYIQDKHPLLSLDNLFYAAPDFSPQIYKRWVSGNDYVVGNLVIDQTDGNIYQCIVNVTDDTTAPSSDPVNWLQGNGIPLSNWLTNKYNQSVTNLFAEVVKRKKLNNAGKTVLERQQLYRGSGSVRNLIVSDGSFVGFQIAPAQAEGLLTYIDQIGIQLTEAQESMNFYLYHSESLAPICTWSLGVANPYTFQWQNLTDGDGNPNAILQYLKQNTYGVYFFGYYQDDLVGQAVSKDWDCTTPCIGCDSWNLNAYNNWSQYTRFDNIKVPSSAFGESRDLFDCSKITHNQYTNWGLNMSMTVRCDLTTFIIYISRNADVADAFAMQFAKELILSIASSNRINPFNTQMQEMARAELDRKFPGAWINDWEKSIDAIELDMSGFSKSCLPCSRANKIKIGSI